MARFVGLLAACAGLVAIACIATAPSSAARPTPTWVSDGVRFIDRSYILLGLSYSVRYRERPHSLVVTVMLKRPTDCGGCSYLTGGTPIRGTQATITLVRRTRQIRTFAVGWP
jgi:hypothetical protein